MDAKGQSKSQEGASNRKRLEESTNFQLVASFAEQEKIPISLVEKVAVAVVRLNHDIFPELGANTNPPPLVEKFARYCAEQGELHGKLCAYLLDQRPMTIDLTIVPVERYITTRAVVSRECYEPHGKSIDEDEEVWPTPSVDLFKKA